MQALIELIAGFVALLAAAALAQFGVDLHAPKKPDREVHRVSNCAEPAETPIMASTTSTQDC
jgi:hypothetical protein